MLWLRKAVSALSTKTCPIERQAEEVRHLKKHESGVVTDPQTVLPTTTLREVKELTERNGFAGYPVVTEENELVGIITGRDVHCYRPEPAG